MRFSFRPPATAGPEFWRGYIIQTIKSMHQEYLSTDTYSDAIISGAMASLLNILARSIEKQYVEQANESDSRFGEILRYINTNNY